MSRRTDGAEKRAPLAEGNPRRLTDARCAWRKMTDEQRAEFLRWLIGETETCPPWVSGAEELLAAANETLDVLMHMPSDDFAKGGDRPARMRLDRAIRFSETGSHEVE